MGNLPVLATDYPGHFAGIWLRRVDRAQQACEQGVHGWRLLRRKSAS